MKYLGIDYGTKRVGVALSDDEGNIAFPLMVIENNNTLLDTILDIIEKEAVAGIVIGESRNYKGEENPLMKDITRFRKDLEEKISVPIYFESEVLTTAEARRVPQASDMPRSRKQVKRKALDAQAAALILQSYLDKQRTESS